MKPSLSKTPWSLAAPAYMVLGIVVGVVFPTEEAQLICEIVGCILLEGLAVCYAVIRIKEQRIKIAHTKFLESQRQREMELGELK